jgi:hypothetical protein
MALSIIGRGIIRLNSNGNDKLLPNRNICVVMNQQERVANPQKGLGSGIGSRGEWKIVVTNSALLNT